MKLAAALLVVIGIIAGAASFWMESLASERRAELEQGVRILHAETLALDDQRPVLLGNPIPGNAWEDYRRALEEVRTLSRKDESVIEAFCWERPGADQAMVEKILKLHSSACDDLSKGARRSRTAAPSRWETGVDRETRPYSGSERLARLTACRARFLAKEGKVAEATWLMLDLLQFGRDLASNANSSLEELSESVCWISLVELRDFLVMPGLSSDDLLSFDRAMELVDRYFPTVAAGLVNDALCLGFELLKPEEERPSAIQVPLRQYWRYAFSRRIADAAAFRRIVAGAKKAAAVQGMSRKEVESFMKRLSDELGSPPHPLIQAYCAQRGLPGFLARRTFAGLRLLRVAVRYRVSGEILELEDPFGTLLLHTTSGNRLTVWSVWLDGIDDKGDDGGIGWLKGRPVPVPGRPLSWVRDLVLEVER